jgi:hypothetical protein
VSSRCRALTLLKIYTFDSGRVIHAVGPGPEVGTPEGIGSSISVTVTLFYSPNLTLIPDGVTFLQYLIPGVQVVA